MENYNVEIEELRAAMENGSINRYTVMGHILDLAFEIGAKPIKSLDDIDSIVEAKIAIRELASKLVRHSWQEGIEFHKELMERNEELIKKVWG